MALRRSVSLLAKGPTLHQNLIQRRDFVIVGAGSAGCVLAHRLAKAGKKVLLIENGPSDRGSWDWWKIHMPAAMTYSLAGTKYNWDYHTVPQKGLDNRKLHQPRGRVLGGTSSINAMAYVRGNALDYERWSEEIGTDGETWNYRHVLPYFKKAQNHVAGSNTYRGGDGPLHVARKLTPEVEAITTAFVEAGFQAGYPKTEDMNGFMQEGFGLMDQSVTPNGERASTATCYLRPLLNAETSEDKEAAARLLIVTGRTATRLLFEGTRAVGVECVIGDTKQTEKYFADSEVLVCGGAVGSPQLLNLSGVGKAADLEALGIEVRHDLPDVGYNLQDHLDTYVQALTVNAPSLYPYAATFSSLPEPWCRYAYRRPWTAVKTGLQWMTQGKGMGASNHFEVGGFIRTAVGKRHPDLQYHFVPGIVVGQLDFLPEHGFQIHVCTMRPTSRGSVKLVSNDFRDSPLIDPNFLGTEQDIVDMRNSIRLTCEIIEQPALADFVKQRFTPEPDFDLQDDAAVDAWARKTCHSAYHLAGTCSMGRVVDAQGRVLGLEGLRVVDASIMPSVTSSNLNAPTIMIAEKIADKILGQELPPDETVSWYEAANWETLQR